MKGKLLGTIMLCLIIVTGCSNGIVDKVKTEEEIKQELKQELKEEIKKEQQLEKQRAEEKEEEKIKEKEDQKQEDSKANQQQKQEKNYELKDYEEYCPDCGHIKEIGGKCLNCGYFQPLPKADDYYDDLINCPNCGNPVHSEFGECGFCGYQIVDED